MTELVTIVKKYGVTGVLCAWLWHTDSRLNKVETALYDCYKTQTMQQNATTRINLPERLLAVLPNDKRTYKRYTKA